MRDLVSDKNLLNQLKAFSGKQINAFLSMFLWRWMLIRYQLR